MTIPVTCAIIIKGNKVLVTQRSEKMRLPLLWEFPGGKLEPGESTEGCLLREIKEELGILVTIKGSLTPITFNYGKETIRLIPFITEYSHGEITLTEHKTFGWFIKEDLKNLSWVPADIPILEEFLSL